jgi:hypothetical protein
MDSVAIIALVVSVITAISQLHLRKVHILCIDSECYKSKTAPPTPIVEQPKHLEDTEGEKLENNVSIYINTNGS